MITDMLSKWGVLVRMPAVSSSFSESLIGTFDLNTNLQMSINHVDLGVIYAAHPLKSNHNLRLIKSET